MADNKYATPYIFVAVIMAALLANGVLAIRENLAIEKSGQLTYSHKNTTLQPAN